jgi:cell division protein FtsQ
MKIQGKYIKIIWVSFIALTALIWIGTVNYRKKSQIKELIVEVKNSGEVESMISVQKVEEILQKSFGFSLIGSQVKDLNIDRVEHTLEQDPSIAKVKAYLDAKNRLQITVFQREPILRIRDNSGGDYYLDASGKKFPWSREYTPRVMVATGNIPPYQEDFEGKEKSTHKDLINMMRFLQQNEFWNKYLQQIHVNEAREFVLIPLIGTHKILFGDAIDLEKKFEKLKIFYDEAIPYKGWREYEVIDVRFKGQVIGRKS